VTETRWPLLVAEPMTFVVEPPAAIGEVVGAWTNNGPQRIKPVPVSLRLLTIAGGVLAGLIVGLVGFFVIGGILEKRGTRIEGDWFLYALGGGGLLGALVMLPFALRGPKVLTLFVGADGCAQISRGKVALLAFADVAAIRTKVSTVRFHGITTSTREFHVRDQRGKERLWYLSIATAKPDDAQYQYGEAVLQAFARYQSERREVR
jgi:hypothetical protein